MNDMEIGKRYRLKEGVTEEQLEIAYNLVDDDDLTNDMVKLASKTGLYLDVESDLLKDDAVETFYGYGDRYISTGYSVSDFFEEVLDEVNTDNTDNIPEALMKQGEFLLKHTPSLPVGPSIQVPHTVPTDTVSIPVIEGSISAVAQVAHTKSETAELVDEINNNKHFAALMEAGDVVCSGYRAMKVIIEENNFNCTPQEILNMIAVKNNMRRYYDNVDR